MKIPAARSVQTTLRQHGLSLVELMVALTVGLILMAGVLSVFITSRQSYSSNSAVAQLQETGRFALDYLTGSVRLAGYMGCARSATTDAFVNQPVPTESPFDFNFNNAMAGYEATGTGPGATPPALTEIPTVGSATYVAGTAPVLDDRIAPATVTGSDLLAVSVVNQNPQPVYLTNFVNNLTFNVASSTGFVVNQLAVVTDCVKATTFQITGIGGGATPAIAHGPGTFPGNNNGGSFFGSESYAPGAMMSAPNTLAFYIGLSADGVSPALYLRSLQLVTATGVVDLTSNQELVSGVENMQVLYGLDTTGAQVPTQYVTADAVPDWNSVVSVRIGLLVRSATGAVAQPGVPPADANCPAGTYDVIGTCITAPADTRLRRVFTATIGVRTALP